MSGDEGSFLDLCTLAQALDEPSQERQQDDQNTPTEFRFFSKLPAELRLRIWELAVPGARSLSRQWNNRKFQYSLLGPVPAVLHASQEARQWLTHTASSSRASSTRYDLIGREAGEEGKVEEGKVFINWSQDDVFIDRGFNIPDRELAQLGELRNLTMSWGRRPCWVKHSLFEGVRFLRRFPALERLTLRVQFASRYPDLDGDECPSDKTVIKNENHEMRVIAAMVLAEVRFEQRRDPSWRPPRVRVVRCA